MRSPRKTSRGGNGNPTRDEAQVEDETCSSAKPVVGGGETKGPRNSSGTVSACRRHHKRLTAKARPSAGPRRDSRTSAREFARRHPARDRLASRGLASILAGDAFALITLLFVWLDIAPVVRREGRTWSGAA